MENDPRAHQIPSFGVAGTSIATLIDLAIDGQAATFRDLASCLGLKPDYTDELWRFARRLRD